MAEYSTSWKTSKQPRKQRKYRYTAPAHVAGKFLSAHLSKPLKSKYGFNSVRIRKGDKVMIMVGNFKGKESKVDSIDTVNQKIFLESVTVKKKQGQISRVPFNPSNLMITDLDLSDKKRKMKLESKKQDQSGKEKTEKKTAEKKPEAAVKPQEKTPDADNANTTTNKSTIKTENKEK